MPWKLYDELIAGIPQNVLVKDYCLGLHWGYVEAESGMGVSYTCRGGATTYSDPRDFTGLPLREMASLAKSWNFEEASLGVAAINAWYNQKPLLDQLGATFDEKIVHPDGTVEKVDAFSHMQPQIRAMDAAGKRANVVVVGHFPHLTPMKEYANLTVLERNCRTGLDTPDPACEYCLPTADFAFITGVSLENKTARRLLELSRNAHITMVGPSVPMCRQLLDAGVDMAAGRYVGPEGFETVRRSVKSGGALGFNGALGLVTVEK